MATPVQNLSALIDVMADWRGRTTPLTNAQKETIAREFTGLIDDTTLTNTEIADRFLTKIFLYIRSQGTHYVGKKKRDSLQGEIDAAKDSAESNISPEGRA